jgi:hypothetical protein
MAEASDFDDEPASEYYRLLPYTRNPAQRECTEIVTQNGIESVPGIRVGII